MDAKATRAIRRLLLLFFLAAVGIRAQNAPYSDIVISAAGRPIAGAGVSVCGTPGLATTAASVTSNLVVLTMASNPITAGFAANMTLQVSGFTGGDTYLKGGTLSGGVITGGFTILSVTSTTITFQLSHANATASSNGFAFQQGNISTPCAPLASISSDQAGLNPIAQPGLGSDNLGNYAFFAVPNSYVVQYSGPGLIVRLRPIGVPCSGNASCTLTGPQSFITSPGVFTNTQTNLSVQSLVNGCIPQTQFQASQGSQNTTDALTGCVTIPAAGSVFNSNAVSGYVNNLNASTFGVGGYFGGTAGITGAHLNTLNSIFDDKGFAAIGYALDLGTNVANASTDRKSVV